MDMEVRLSSSERDRGRLGLKFCLLQKTEFQSGTT